MKKHHYQCNTCNQTFDFGKIVADGDGKEYERCPYCESWNYRITNLSLKTVDGVYMVEYITPSVGMILFSSHESSEAQRVLNRLGNLKWDIFQSVIADKPGHEARLYLSNAPCLMNGFLPCEFE